MTNSYFGGAENDYLQFVDFLTSRRRCNFLSAMKANCLSHKGKIWASGRSSFPYIYNFAMQEMIRFLHEVLNLYSL